MTLHWITLYLLSVALVVSSQSSNVTCDVSFAWTENTKEQNPCVVSSYLQSACARAVSVNEIPVGTHYLGPQTAQQATTCSCSSVVYSLTSACGMCQGRTIVNWTSWANNCPEAFQSMGSFPLPIPVGTDVPGWAYLNITESAGGGWDQFRAKAAADEAAAVPSSSAPPRPSQSTIGTSSEAPTSAPSQTASSRSQTPSGGASGETTGSSSNAGAIAGGVVGGLVGLVGIGLLALWLLLRKKRKEKSAPPKDFVIDEPTSTTAMVFHNSGHSTTMSPPPQSHRTPTPYSSNIYVAAQEERPPPPMRHASSISDMYTTLTTRRSQESFNISQFGTHVPPSTAGYRGAPEV